MDFLPPLDSPCPGGQRNNHVISFRHPAYPRTERELLRFNALDGLDKDGFDFDLALISCGIVTGNTWKTGWLATSDDLEQFVRVERPDDNILRSQTYYYFVGDHEPTYQYPIVPSFHHWQFPHGELPDLWADIDILPDAESQTTRRDEAVLSRDATCRITACKGAREVAHLVPAGELYWFGQNQMRQYCLDQLSSMSINDTRNILLLRRDMHFLFDNHRFVLAAKQDRSNKAHLVLHVLSHERADELVPLYHNRLTQTLRGISTEFLFARLAFTLFNSIHFPPFDGMARLAVLLYDPESGRIRDDNLFQQQIRGKMKLFDTYSRSQSRSASPKKRSRDESAHEEVSAWNLDHDSENWDDLVYSDSPPRGRRRKRSWDAQAQESPPGLAASSTSPRRTSASPRSIQLPESACQREPYLAGSQGSQEINAKGFDEERPAKRGRTEIEWQVNS
ncbi:uncharacterized protein FTOL_04493 [Fusarium torulosum]|uniref:HNH nuclease domain-containing protein n=1 Tax=Fusarium torulosum TaxID=33205 RepID=A0AAE8SGR8_9HYPO|nr:uncharacterized protein FTOL_04493 [Fusarium torulosum]